MKKEGREILFRGQTQRKGERVWMSGQPVDSEWKYGGIFPNNNGGAFSVIYQYEPKIEKFSVYTDTVCEYTGLLDADGVRIFEKDILENERMIGVVHFNEGSFKINWKSKDRYRKSEGDCILTKIADFEKCKVIGNVFDSPELLEVKYAY